MCCEKPARLKVTTWSGSRGRGDALVWLRPDSCGRVGLKPPRASQVLLSWGPRPWDSSQQPMVPETGSGPIHGARTALFSRLLPREHCTWRQALSLPWSGHSSAPQRTHEPNIQEASFLCPGSSREPPGQEGPSGSLGPAGGTGCPYWLLATCLH